MSTTAILIALFVAAQSPTKKNCTVLRDGLVRQASEDAFKPGAKVTWDEDTELIMRFVKTTCKVK